MVRPTMQGVARACLATGLLLTLVVGFQAALSATPATDGNPDLQPKCGIDITLVIDRSGSIDDNDDEVRDAGRALIRALVGTGSRVQIITFSTTATALVRNGPGNYSHSEDLEDLEFYDASLVTDLPAFDSDGFTNWDDGLEMARRSPAGIAPLTVILTDGDPTKHLETAPDGHGLGVDDGDSGTSNTDIDRADQEADFLRSGAHPAGSATPTHLFAVGVGLGDSANPPASNTSEGRLRRITGDEQLTFSPGGDVLLNGVAGTFGAADYVIVDEFDQLETSFERFVRELCAPSLNLVKHLQQADGTTVQAGAGGSWSFGLTATPGPASWQSPALPPGTTTASLATDSQGRASFKWEPQPVNGTTQATVAELGTQPGYVFNGARCFRNDFSGTTTVIPGLSVVPPNQVGSQAASTTWTIPSGVAASEGVSCEVYNRQLRPSVIQVDKVTVPANLPHAWSFTLASGPTTIQTLPGITHATAPTSFAPVLPGTYSVTESVVAGFTSVGTCDNLGTPGDEALSPTGLLVGEAQTWRCTFTSTAQPGSIRVVKQTTGAPVGTFSFTSTLPGLGSFQLTTGGGTASTTTVPAPVGSYSVSESNPTPWSATGASCSDGSPITAIAVGPGEAVVCTFTNQAPAPTITVDKQADRSTVPETGATVTYTVTIGNTSVETLEIDQIRDAVGGGTPFDVGGTCDDRIGTTIAAGTSVTCQFSLAAGGVPGDVVADVVSVTASDTDGNPASDTGTASVTVTDVSPTIAVTKTPGVGSVLEPGGPVTYTVGVENTSAEPLEIVSVTDAVGGGAPTAVCAGLVGDALAPGESTSCSFSLPVTGDAGDTVADTVSVVVEDDDGTSTTGTATATVDIDDRLPAISVTKTAGSASVAEPGGPVTFTVQVGNLSPEPVVIGTTTDAVDGGSSTVCASLDGDSLAPVGTPGSTATCTFTRTVDGNANETEIDVVTVTASDDEGNPASASDDAAVGVTDVMPTITVDKAAAPTSLPESGGTATFTVVVTNTSSEPVTVTSIDDAVDGGAPAPLSGECGDLVGDQLAPGASTSCSFEVELTGDDAGSVATDIVTVRAADDDGGPEAVADDDAAVTFSDVLPGVTVSKTAATPLVDEPGGDVTFTVEITNTAAEPVTITSITELLPGQPAQDAPGDCPGLVGTVLAEAGSPGYQATCTFTVPVAGNAGAVVTDTVTVVVVDDERNEAADDDSATVTLTAVAPTISVVKTADQPTVGETAGTASYSVLITNTSAVEGVTITGIVDAVDGGAPAGAGGTCAGLVGSALAPTASVGCTFTVPLAGGPGTVVGDVVTVTGEDDDGQPAEADDDAQVTITDEAPSISVTKTASTATVIEPGSDVAYTVTIGNPAAEPITIQAIVDVVDGGPPIPAPGTCAALIGTVLAPGGTQTCSFTLPAAGNAGDTVEDTVTVTALDDEQNQATGSASAVVAVLDADPVVTVEKAAVPTTVPEPGGTATFTVTISNGSFEDVVITTIHDEVDGVVTDVATLGAATDCDELIGTTLAAQANVACTFDAAVAGNAGDTVTDTVTVVVVDDEQGHDSGSGTATVGVTDLVPTVEVRKVADVDEVDEPGGDVTFTVTIRNTSVEPVTIESIVDAVLGGEVAAGGTCPDLVGDVLAPSASVSCQFPMAISGDAGDEIGDTVTVTVGDDEGNTASDDGSEVVAVADVPPTISVVKLASVGSVLEPGGQVPFLVTIVNDSPEAVTIRSLTDTIGGGEPFTPEGECADLIGTTIDAGASVTCSFVGAVSGDAGDALVDVVRVGVVDDDGTRGGDRGSAIVDIDDAQTGITVTKVATSTSIDEPGGTVGFEVTITNDAAEPATITSIVDSVDGGEPFEVGGTCADLLGTTLAPGETTACTFEVDVVGVGDDVVIDTVTVVATDDEENETADQASATVDIADLPPSASAAKVATPASVDEPGGPVAFAASITNTGTEPLTVIAVSDAVGDSAFDVTAVGGPITSTTCGTAVGTVLAPGGSYVCTFSLVVAGNAGTNVVDTVRFGVRDDDGNEAVVTASDDVDVDDVLPTLAVAQDNGPGLVVSPGGDVMFLATIVNHSPEAVTLVSLTETIDDGLPLSLTTASELIVGSTCSLGVVLAPAGQPGDTHFCTFSLHVSGLESVVDTQVIQAVAVDDEGNLAPAAAAELTAVIPVADLAIAKEAVGPIGATATYRLTVANLGPSTATGLVVTDQLPAGLTATTAAGDGWTCAIEAEATVVTCTRPSLAPDATSAITVGVAVDARVATSPITNTASVTARTGDDDLANNQATSTDRIDVAVLGEVVRNLARTGSAVRLPLILSALLLAAGTWLLLLDTHLRRRSTLRP